MTTTEETVARVQPPELRDGRPHCPRCANRLLFDGDHFLCLACGYEYTPAEREAEVLLGRRRERRREAAALAVGAGAVAGMFAGGLAVAAALVAAAAFFVTGRFGRRRR